MPVGRDNLGRIHGDTGAGDGRSQIAGPAIEHMANDDALCRFYGDVGGN